MAPETFQKRQKEAARREKQKMKLARRLERRNEKARDGAADPYEGSESAEKSSGDNSATP